MMDFTDERRRFENKITKLEEEIERLKRENATLRSRDEFITGEVERKLAEERRLLEERIKAESQTEIQRLKSENLKLSRSVDSLLFRINQFQHDEYILNLEKSSLANRAQVLEEEIYKIKMESSDSIETRSNFRSQGQYPREDIETIRKNVEGMRGVLDSWQKAGGPVTDQKMEKHLKEIAEGIKKKK